MKRFKLFMEAEPSIEDRPDPNAQADSAYTATDGKETDQSITGVDPDDAVEDEIEQQEEKEEDKQETRLLGIDKRKMNKQFKELSVNPVNALPLNAVQSILSNNNLKLTDENGADVVFELKGTDGDMDFDLITTDTNKRINNSMGILQWHKNDDGSYNFNFYLG